MGLIKNALSLFSDKHLVSLNEELSQFRKKGEYATPPESLKSKAGEGFEYFPGLDIRGLSSFNIFYSKYINQKFETEVKKIKNYRQIAEMPEIADVIEDAVIESAQEDFNGEIVRLDVVDEELGDSAIVDRINEEFENLFYNRIRINEVINNWFRTYYIDGRFYYERIIDTKNQKDGIVGIKPLPSETIDFDYDYTTGRIERYYQYLTPASSRPNNLEVAVKNGEVVIFEPQQIGQVDYGIYGTFKNEIIGYLEKVKVPYNQLKLLETSVVIYRIIRAPERFVFKIDVGNMPKDKAVKYVEKVKQSLTKKQSYDPTTGNLTGDVEVMSILDNFFIPVAADQGRGSDITTIGGAHTAGFSELKDIEYFQRKLYRAMKYPMSRVSQMEAKQEGGITFVGRTPGEIPKDEIKWAVFLERHQNRFCMELLDLFLLHLEFKGMKTELELTKNSFNIVMTPPSFFRDRQQQMMLEVRHKNYNDLSNKPEFSKSFLMKRYLDWQQEDIEANAKGLKEDIKLGLVAKKPEMDGPPKPPPAPPQPKAPEIHVHTGSEALKDEKKKEDEEENPKKKKKEEK